MSHEPDEVWERFAVALAEMARDLLAQDSAQGTLDRIVEHAKVLINGCDHAGILTVRRGEVHALAATSDLVRRADRIQQDLQEGPCFDAVTDRQQVYTIQDLRRPHDRWPHFAPELNKLGMGSAMGFLLFTEDDDLGALNVYSRQPGTFDEAAQRAGWILASHAAVAFSAARTHQQLGHALETRHEIGEAMGILMERHGLTEDTAFKVLKKASQDRNIKLREIARLICETGEKPG
ncbi:transcriptional regulator with GAF, ATPase, and Fis domain [Streptomyces phaeochromogenes]|jgi:transcriptional regulator with GAF, ATPase, and Fis domain|uniref:GAF and ANTAR domain-containing protein n=1 Tax=Streptomyces phaeochromogenes TaxID=1923 RepID=UPI002790305A|nr:GAF and ANTAR domain-containing protein [Streptomyces phaeochromogenes]MDQ0947383.1 transcriptional regulator with GAF, ATPase, and Fis domain [Streptomyces phaeochromogenes]